MGSHLKVLSALVLFCIATDASAVTRVVNSTSNSANLIGTLPYWLLNADDGDTIDCNAIAGQSIVLTSSLPAITKSYTINGAGITINGANSHQAFQVASGTIVINHITIENAISKGGKGGDGYSGGGGAVGGGGALYVHGNASVTMTAASLLNNIAQGGNGGSADNNGNSGGGGGGGFDGGIGGDCISIVSTGGGGGGHSNGGDGGSNVSVNGSNGEYFGGGGGGAGMNSVVPGGIGGKASPTSVFFGGNQSNGNGGGGAGDSQDGFAATGSGTSGVPGNGGNGIGADLLFGGGGGGGASSETLSSGGIGIGAGGGGGGSYSGGTGGILGGGGGGGSMGSVGGAGGFGAGGGGASTGGNGGAGFNAGGGNGGSELTSVAGGGGGSGLGGAIFIQSGGSLTIVDAEHISGNAAIAGIGGSSTNASDPGYIAAGSGAAMGHDIFVREQGLIIFNVSNTLTIATPIEGDHTNGPGGSGGLQKIGVGVLNLNGANTYSGMTTINGGTLNLNGSIIGSMVIGASGKLSGNATISGDLTNSGSIQSSINSSGTASLVSVAGATSLAGSLEMAIDPNAPLGTYTVLTSPSITGHFNAVTFAGLTPVAYSVSYPSSQVQFSITKMNASKVTGNGTIAGSSGVITFDVKAEYNSKHQIMASMFYNDPGAGIHFDNPVVTTLTFSGNQTTLAGTARVHNQNTSFTSIITGGNPGSFSLSLGNGYSASGNLTSGSIIVQ